MEAQAGGTKGKKGFHFKCSFRPVNLVGRESRVRGRRREKKSRKRGSEPSMRWDMSVTL